MESCCMSVYCPQLRYQKCLDARPPSLGSCLPTPPADSMARRVRMGVQSLLGSFKQYRSGSQSPWDLLPTNTNPSQQLQLIPPLLFLSRFPPFLSALHSFWPSIEIVLSLVHGVICNWGNAYLLVIAKCFSIHLLYNSPLAFYSNWMSPDNGPLFVLLLGFNLFVTIFVF